MENNKKITFSRDDTTAVKGIAVIMMLMHHLAGFNDRLPLGFGNFESSSDWFVVHGYLNNIAKNMNICVGIFLFLGGYGMYCRYRNGKFDLVSSLVGLLKRYWKIFAIFVPIAFIFFSRSGDGISPLAARYNFEDVRNLLTVVSGNFFLLNDNINPEWWFMRTYVYALILGAVYMKLTEKVNSFPTEFVIVVLLDITCRSILPALPGIKLFEGLNGNFITAKFIKESQMICSFFGGIVFAKYNGITRAKELLSGLPCKHIIGLLGAGFIVWSRAYIVNNFFDIIYVPVFIALISTFLDWFSVLKTFWKVMGINSMNMWLIHTFYCYYFLEATHLVYSTRNVLIDLAILVGMSFLSSVAVELIYKYIGKGIDIFRNKFKKELSAASS